MKSTRGRLISLFVLLLLALCLNTSIVVRNIAGRRGTARPNAPQTPVTQNRPHGTPAAQASPPSPVFGRRQGRFTLTGITPRETAVRFETGRISVREVISDGRRYSIITAEGADTTTLAGAPALPIYRCDLTVPATGAYTINVKSASCPREILCPPPLPSAGMQIRGAPPVTPQPDPAIYDARNIHPSSALKRLSPYKLRDAAGIGLALMPVAYDFARGVLLVSERVDFILRADNATSQDYGSLATEWNFRAIQTATFLNAPLLRSATCTPPSLLIIVPDDWFDALSAFTAWKKALGYNLTTARYPTDTEDGASSIASFISAAYDNNGITHVILCGDADDIPPAYTSENTSSPGTKAPTSDSQYALICGDDYIPDIFISRIPASSKITLSNILTKLSAYEAEPPDDDGWRSNATFLASLQRATTSPYKNKTDKDIVAECCHNLLDAAIYSSDSTELYAPNATAALLTNALNAGSPLLIYLGHGSSTDFVTSSFNASNAIALTNSAMLPFIFAPVCDVGNFAYPSGDCLAEAFFHASNGNGITNGAAAILASTSNTYWNPPIKATYTFTNDIIASRTAERLTQFGAYCHNAIQTGAQLAESSASTEKASSTEKAFYFVHQMTLFGDCSMFSRLTSLREISVTTSYTDSTIDASVHWSDDSTPLPGAIITITPKNNPDNILYAVTDECGAASVLFSDHSDSPTLSVHDPSCRSYTQSIYFAVQSDLTLDDSFTGTAISIHLVPNSVTTKDCTTTTGTVPDGLSVTTDGILQGTPTIAGTYSFVVTCHDSNNTEYHITITATVFTKPDDNNDGSISNQELLAFMSEFHSLNGHDNTLQTVLALWTAESDTIRSSTTTSTTSITSQQAPEPQPLPDLEADVTLHSHNDFFSLQHLGADIVAATGTTAHIYATSALLDAIRNAGFTVSNISALEHTRTNTLYLTPEELNTQLLGLAASAWPLVRPSFVGLSTKGREILALRITAVPDNTPAPKLLITGCIHGNERPSMMLPLRFADFLVDTYLNGGSYADDVTNLLNSSEIWLLPCLNPDGCAAVSRYNANGYDLNRNFPDGVQIPTLGTLANADSLRLDALQPEQQLFIRWSAAHAFSAALHLHTGSTLVCYPYGNYLSDVSEAISPDNQSLLRLANTYTDNSSSISTVILSAAWYPVIGELPDWTYRFLGTLPLTVELMGNNGYGKESDDSTHLDTLWDNNRDALLQWAKAASTGVIATVTSLESGNPIQYATVTANSTFPIHTGRDGVAHKTLPPGSFNITVSAPGFNDLTFRDITVIDGKYTPITARLSPSSTLAVEMNSSQHRHLPFNANDFTVTATGDRSALSNIILSITPPDNWAPKPTSIADVLASRSVNGCTSFLLNNGASLLFTVTPPPQPNADNIITAAAEWDGGASSISRIWLSAEKSSYTLSLTPGWNLAPFPAAVNPDDIPDNLGMWSLQNNCLQQLSTPKPLSAAWLLVNNSSSTVITAWMPDPLTATLSKGWNLISSPWSLPQSTFNSFNSFIFLNKCFLRSTPSGNQPAFLFSFDNSFIQIE